MNGMSRLTASSMSAWVDGPKADRSASRMSFSSSSTEVERGRDRIDQVVDQGDRHPAGLDPDVLLAELVDDVVLAVRAGRPGLAVADVGPGQVLELERDVLGDVTGPRPLAQPGDEAAAPAERAGVVLERRQQLDEAVDEAGDLVRRELLEDAEVDEHAARPARAPSSSGRAGSASRRSAGSVRAAPRRAWRWSAGLRGGLGWSAAGLAGRPWSLGPRDPGRLPLGGRHVAASPPLIARSCGVATRWRRRRSNL